MIFIRLINICNSIIFINLIRLLIVKNNSVLVDGAIQTSETENVLNPIPIEPIDDWFNKVNEQYDNLLRYSSYIEWELLVRPSEKMVDRGLELVSIKTRWHNLRCGESDRFKHLLDDTFKQRMVFLCCRGPKFTEYQSRELSTVLNRMANIYSGTSVCLPKHFDVCKNSDRLWDYTFAKVPPNGDVYPLEMKAVRPEILKNRQSSSLNYWDGVGNNEYFIQSNVEDDDIVRGDISFKCYEGEPDLETLMTGDFTALGRPDCHPNSNYIFNWAWQSWRMAVGPPISLLFPQAVQIFNIGAQNAGYNDIGETWMEELEMINLRANFEHLWETVKPFYTLLHSVLRHMLRLNFASVEEFVKDDMIPAHILGNMWSQDWSVYLDYMLPFAEINLNSNMKNTNWSSNDMVKRSEDFYASMGLPRMTKEFWENSVFEMNENLTNCHGAAANMNKPNDYRMLVCPKKTIEDFYVIHHEMGHIHYYMGAEKQPPIFRDATNTAFSESVGDAVFLGVMTPQHLNRLRLIPDSVLFPEKLPKMRQDYLRMLFASTKENDPDEFMESPIENNMVVDEDLVEILSDLQKRSMQFVNKTYPKISENILKRQMFDRFKEVNDFTMNSFDLSLLLRMALSKIPQIPFEYVLDVFRWDMFSEKVSMRDANKYFWHLTEKEQGIRPPDHQNRDDLFDAAAKFHFANNIPYARYFLASFLHVQIFKGLCEATVFGTLNQHTELPMPLHRCDIYGSKRAGKLLKKAMALGSSVHWTEVLFTLTGKTEITADALLEYYQPLINWLEKIVIEYNIPIGW